MARFLRPSPLLPGLLLALALAACVPPGTGPTGGGASRKPAAGGSPRAGASAPAPDPDPARTPGAVGPTNAAPSPSGPASPAGLVPSPVASAALLPPPAGLLRGRVVAAGADLIADAGGRLLGDHGGGFLSDQGSGVIANNGGGLVGDQGSGIIANNSGGLRTYLGSGIVATNSGGLRTYLGSGSVATTRGGYRLLDLAAGPVGGAVVQLLDAAGAPFGPSAASAADGGFELPAPPAAGGPFTLRATFGTAGKAFTWRAALDPAAAEAPLLDEASTLAAERGGAPPAALAALAKSLRAELAADVLPYMAADSADRGAALDQLLLDRAALRQAAAAAAPGLDAVRGAWTVDTPLSFAMLAGSPLAERLDGLVAARAFVADPATGGTVVTLPGSAGQRLVLLRPDGKPALVAQLPREVGVPIRLARGADGRLHAAARLQDSNEVRVWVVEADGTVVRLPGVLAQLNAPGDIDLGQVAVDATGRIYMADTRAHVVRRLGPADAVSVVVAGREGEGGSADGAAGAARFQAPEGVAIAPDGTLHVADTGNHALRRIAPDGTVSTVAGQAGQDAYRNGRGQAARLGAPEALAFGPGGDVYVLDRAAHRVRRLSKAGSVFLVAGTEAPGEADGPGPVASFQQPSQLALGADGALFLRDTRGADRTFVIRRLRPPAPAPIPRNIAP